MRRLEKLCEDDGERTDEGYNRKEDILPRKYEGVLLCWAALSFHFQSKRSAVSLEV